MKYREMEQCITKMMDEAIGNWIADPDGKDVQLRRRLFFAADEGRVTKEEACVLYGMEVSGIGDPIDSAFVANELVPDIIKNVCADKVCFAGGIRIIEGPEEENGDQQVRIIPIDDTEPVVENSIPGVIVMMIDRERVEISICGAKWIEADGVGRRSEWMRVPMDASDHGTLVEAVCRCLR